MTRKRSDSEVWYRAPASYGLSEDASVDRENRVLRGFSVMELGDARGHGEEIDQRTLDLVVELSSGGEGKKMRFGHPGMSDDAIGSMAARGRNFRHAPEGGKVIGDAHFVDAAYANNAAMVEHVFRLAEDDPSALGTSIVMKRELEFRLNEDGTRVKGEDDKELPPLVRPIQILASDFVDTPAATSSLFSGTNVLLSAEMTEIIDEILDGRGGDSELSDHSRQILDSILKRPDAEDRVRSFIDRYFTNRRRDREEPMKHDRNDDVRSAWRRLGDRLGFSSDTTVGPPKGRPSPAPRPLAIPAPEATHEPPPTLTEPLASSTTGTIEGNLLASGSAPELEMLELMKAQGQQIDAMQSRLKADQEIREATTTAEFEAKADALVGAGKLTATGAKAVLAQAEVYMKAGLDPSELLVPFESAPAPEELASLTESVTFTPPNGEPVNVDVNFADYGAAKGADGTLIFDRPAAIETAGIIAGATTPQEAMRRLSRAFAKDGRL